MTFYLTVSPEKAHAVSFSEDDNGLLFTATQERKITWSPDLVLPDQRIGSAVSVDIELYRQEHTRNAGSSTFTWRLIKTVAENTPNDGEETITIPSAEVNCNSFITALKKGFTVCPVAIKISVSAAAVLPSSIGIWSGIAFLRSVSVKGLSLRSHCDVWASNEVSISPLLRRLQPCPPNQLVADFDVELEREDRSSMMDTSKNYEQGYMEYFHPNINVCYRQNA